MHRLPIAALVAYLLWPASPRAQAPRSSGAHVMPKLPPGTLARAAPPGTHLDYWGGPVVSGVKVAMVLWGSGTYQAFVEQSASPSLATFYAGVVDSPYLDWLAEYDTDVVPSGGGTGTQQAIGRGSYLGQLAISPSPANDGTTVDDSSIQAELDAQIAAGNLPAPAVDAAGFPVTVYMVHFPRGKTVTLGGSTSCVEFCAYHSTLARTGPEVYYAVLPDMSSGTGCDTGCGSFAGAFDNQTLVASHELVEAVTDPAVGLAVVFGPPLSWYDQANGEIADICNGLPGTVVGGDGVTYGVQQLWSNAAGACVTTRADDFSIAVSPSSRTVLQGSTATFSVSTAVVSGNPPPVTLSATGLPPDVTPSFSPASVTAGQGSTLTLTASAAAALQTTTFSVVGTAGAASHSATADVSVLPAADFSVALSPSDQVVPRGHGLPYLVSTAVVRGTVGTVSLSVSGLPAGVSASFDPAQVAAGLTSQLTLTPALDAALGPGTFQVTASAGGLSRSAGAAIRVTPVLSVAPASATLPPRGTATFAAAGGAESGYAWEMASSASGGTIDASTGLYRAGDAGDRSDVVRVRDALGLTATAAVSVSAGVSISPPAAQVAPGGSQAFAAAGGSGAPYAWSLATNASGGSIDAAGNYRAGPTAGVTDVVRAADSLGNAAVATATVPAPPAAKGGCGCGAGGGDPLWLLALGAPALLRRRGRVR
jgi:MYXO-CTERM domain-containing protein